MQHESALLVTLAVAFGLAFVMGLGAMRLRLPPLVGYLVAGSILGPFTPGFVADASLASQLAEVGVILLMFGVGLHFSIKDLLAVRRIAVPGALLRIVVVTGLTILVARMWSWSAGAGLVFGLALSVASTVVVLRALDELGLMDSSDGRLAVGWLVVEDLAMVLVLVLLPPLAGALGGVAAPSDRGIWIELGFTLVKVAAFVVLMLFVGTRTVPWMLQRVARTGSRELFTLTVLAVALGVAVGAAALFGVSFALGAFFAGVVIAESDLSHQAAADALPLQDAFAVLFFVSVGMLFDYRILLQKPWLVLETLAIIVVAKFMVTFAIAIAWRRTIRSALLLSASLAQIGEFSFILAGLGISYGLLTDEARNLILAGSIASIVLNPLLLRAIAGMERWIEARPSLVHALERQTGAEKHVEAPPAMSHHVVLVGFGRVGRRIGDALRSAQIPFIVVERDHGATDALRKEGVPVVFGDAARPGILDHVHLETAKLLVIASPDAYQAQRVIEIAREKNPRIEIMARTHNEGMQRTLEESGVQRAFMGERELALSMAHYALMRMGRTDDDDDATVDEMRRITNLGGRAVRR